MINSLHLRGRLLCAIVKKVLRLGPFSLLPLNSIF